MPLSRLENFLKNAEGNILYVNPSDFDSTDSIENRGNSLTRPFRTIQRALLEAARFSYLPGKNNDKIDSTTILVYPGTHYIDNRPGFSIKNSSGTAEFKRLVSGNWTTSGATLTEFTENSNFDIFDEDNDLYKYNSVYGGAVLPRGTSIVGLDLRKTKLRPLYVPDPLNDDVDKSAIFRVTGTCYFTAFTIFDADPQRSAYKDTSFRKVTPNFSHHKLTCFEYADGVNDVLLGGTEKTGITDLDMYYAKVSYAYGDTSGRGIGNFPSSDDFEPSIDETRIVGDLRADPIGITSIRSGNGVTPTTTITVTTLTPHNLFTDTPILITGITTNTDTYTGSLVVSNVVNDTEFQYIAPQTPTLALPTFSQIINGKVIVESDSVSSASPYIFSCTLRSVFGMNGMFADGNKATGFKSMLVAQFTGISLQKDDNAFALYDETTGIYNDDLTVDESEKPLHTNSRAIYKPDWENVHIKVTNNSIIQAVSVFAIGFGKHFVAETGGDMSITNSNSNFGAVALESAGFRDESFDRDDAGYITHVIPPRELNERITNVTWLPLDVEKIISEATPEKLFISGYNSQDIPPPSQIDSYRIGAKEGEELYLSVIIGAQENNFQSPILMPVPSGIGTSSKKRYELGRTAGINSVSSNIFTLKSNHQLFNGEKVRISSNTGELPENISNEKIYYAYTSGLASNELKLSSTLNDANSGNTISGISNGGGQVYIESYVADKLPGEAGHPIQWDSSVGNWYILGSNAEFYNTIYGGVVGIGTTFLGNQTGSTFIKRRIDNRGLDDKLYKVRYVVPKEFVNARPPTDGFILQESKNVGIGSVTFITSTLANTTQLRNPKIIKSVTYNLGNVTVGTELPHGLVAGDFVKLSNIESSNSVNTSYNGVYEVDTVTNPREFRIVGFTSDPGTFLNQVNQRSTQQQVEDLPTVQRYKYKDSLFIYRSSELKPFIPGASGQDGIYNLTLLSGSVSPSSLVGFGLSTRKFNQDVKNLYPQQDRDNYNSDPNPTISHARLSPVGVVETNDKRNSLTKEALNYFLQNNRIGYAITGVSITGSGNTTISLYTDINHRLKSVKSVSLIDPGSGYNNSAGVTTTIYSAELSNAVIDGRGASAKVTVSAANTVTSVEIVDGGSFYGIGNTMAIAPDPAGAPTSQAVVQVTEVNDPSGGSIELSGFEDDSLNGIFKILSIDGINTITLESEFGLPSSVYTERLDGQYPVAYISDSPLGVSTIAFTQSTGITTVTCSETHGLLPGNSFNVVGTGGTYFTKKFTVDEVLSTTQFTFNAGITTVGVAYTYTGLSIHKSAVSSNGKALGAGEENLGGRGQTFYAGISTTTSALLTSTDTQITLISAEGFKKGDYISVNQEILRLSSDPTGTTFDLLRGQFSTVATTAAAGSRVRKVSVLPLEIRRPSILRASGHTFEYLGYGPGNYSTGLPLKQDRLLSDRETLVSQAREQDGGTVVYTGMNDSGEFFSGATKINGATGEEETIEAPVTTFFGDDLETGQDKRNSGVFDDIVIKERMTVEGGENNNQTSQFYGPVNFSQKVTSASEEGIETRDLYIKGVASQPKLITVGIATPTEVKKSGDISFLSTPDPGGYAGHIFADGNWRRFGMISVDKDRDFLKLDQIGIGESVGIYNFRDALEVNGTVKVRNLYVGGAVTFAGAQAIGNASFDVLDVNKTIVFGGIGTNYTVLTENADTIAQFQNIEVTGYAATFTNAVVIFENSFNSTYAGVSTIAGTLNVNNITSNSGVVTVTAFNATSANAGDLSVANTGYIQSGIITGIRAASISGDPSAGAGLTVYANAGIITSVTGTAATITTLNSTDLFSTGIRATNKFATPLAHVNAGVITNLYTTTGSFATGYINAGFTTTAVVTGWLGAPTAYINSGIVTSIITQYIGGTAAAPNVANFNIGVVTSLTGTAVTMANIQATSSLVSQGTLAAPVGVVTIMSGEQASYAGIVTAQLFKSTVTGAAPFIVASDTKVTNLNADLLDGLDTSSTDQSGNSVVIRSGGDFSAKNVTLSARLSADNVVSGKYYKVGDNVFLSEAANGVVRLSNYQSYDGATTTVNSATVGSGLELSGQTFRVYKHNGSTTITNLLSIDASGNGTFAGEVTANSDERIKTNIKTIENGLDKVLQLRGVEYDRTDIEKHQIGVIAQEVEKVIPDVVNENEDGLKSVAYGNLVAVLIEAVKDLKGEITELRAELDELKGNK